MGDYLRILYHKSIDFGEIAINYLRGVVPASSPQVVEKVEHIIERQVLPEHFTQGRIMLRLAGISGAAAIILGGYGAHALMDKESDRQRRAVPNPNQQLAQIFSTANRYHLIHTLAIALSPLTRRPRLVGSFFLVGTVLFSGSCYYHALTGDGRFRPVTPFGGLTLILAWIIFFWNA